MVREFRKESQTPIVLYVYLNNLYEFLDLETRLCTVHTARPSVCRGHPDGPNCGYYTFLMSERRDQDDPDFDARAYNVPGEFPKLEAGDR